MDDEEAREAMIAATMTAGVSREEAEDILRRVGQRLERDHRGGFVWINGAEQWQCDADCPHPSHEGGRGYGPGSDPEAGL